MLLTPDCILCNYKFALAAIREVTDREDTVKELIADIMQVPALQGRDWSVTSPGLVEKIIAIINSAQGSRDPFYALKERQNRKCLQLYPWLKSLINDSEDPLLRAVNLATIGNSIGPMGYLIQPDLEESIRGLMEKSVPRGEFIDFKKRLERTDRILYIGDNCGEIVLDRLLIETIKARYDLEVVFVVRNVPTVNDVTMEEAHLVGLDQTATVVGNGIDGPFPGTSLARCSEQFLSLWSSADLIISKGGGNFDSLDEENVDKTPICFMLMCKCPPYRDRFGVPIGEPILSAGGMMCRS